MNADKCPNCGDARYILAQHIYDCGSFLGVGHLLQKSRHCQERVASQKAEKERDAETWRVGQAEQELAKVRSERDAARADLEETRRKLEDVKAVVIDMTSEAKSFQINASIHRARGSRSAESVAMRASELLERFAKMIQDAEKGGGV